MKAFFMTLFAALTMSMASWSVKYGFSLSSLFLMVFLSQRTSSGVVMPPRIRDSLTVQLMSVPRMDNDDVTGTLALRWGP